MEMKPLFRELVVLLACAYLCGCCSLDCRNSNPKREDGSVALLYPLPTKLVVEQSPGCNELS